MSDCQLNHQTLNFAVQALRTRGESVTVPGLFEAMRGLAEFGACVYGHLKNEDLAFEGPPPSDDPDVLADQLQAMCCPDEDSEEVQLIGAKAISPAAIMLLIQVGEMLFRFFKERKQS